MWLGLARQRSLIVPSWRGWLLLFGILTLTLFLFTRQAYRFLALNTPLPQADVLLVEGWVSDLALEEAKRIFEAGQCQMICTVGVSLDRGRRLSEWQDWANVAGHTLIRLGIPKDKIMIVPGGNQPRHRTHASFLAARQQFAQLPQPPRSLNILTEAHHGRRSAMVGRKVFGSEMQVGVRSTPPQAYDPKGWWRSSAGVKNVIMESIATAYEALRNSGRNS